MTFHPFHMVHMSPWPLASSLGALLLTSGLILSMNFTTIMLFFLSVLILTMISTQWWRDITRESTHMGLHTNKVLKGLQKGILLFILSEILFFFSFFWCFFHGMLAPDTELGILWPPKGVEAFNPFQIPLLNTMILLGSGVSLTWSHACLNMNKIKEAFCGILHTIAMGWSFTLLQLFEYYTSMFSFSDAMFGSIFFMATGFHGLHVLIGTIFLMISYIRMKLLHFNENHHFGFEASAWYWHFVDLVWLYLFLFMYWWIY